ncbi:MAG: hypothetical protein CMQ16_01110 [Gammaproteobacteria bacterium]|nr:hypothetical protein [Gammaproteobacteria bacterium]
MSQTALLTPIFVLVLWTSAIFLVLAFGRIKYTKNPQDAAHSKDLKGTMPDWVERAADNYNHLFEQPVAFYALTLCIAVINNFDCFMVQLAWAFVVLRIMHSLVQLTFNLVLLRFFIFVMGWLVLALMAYSQLFA